MAESPPTTSPTAPLGPTTVSPPGAAEAGPPAASQPQPQAQPQAPAIPADVQFRANAYGEFEPVIGKLRSLGITRVEQLQQMLEPHEIARSKGLDLRQVLNGLSEGGTPKPQAQQAAAGDGQPQSLTMNDLQSFFEEREFQQAERAGYEAESRAIRQVASELGGKTPEGQRAVEAILSAELSRLNPVYPFGHPRYGQERPATAQEIEGLKAAVRPYVNALVGTAAVAAAQQPAAAPTTPGGANGLGGQTPAASPKSSLMPDMSDIEARARAHAQRLGVTAGQPMSTATV